MDHIIKKNLKWLQLGPIGPDLLFYANKLGIQEDELRVIIAHFMASRSLVEISDVTHIDQNRLNKILSYRWAIHVHKKPSPRPYEKRTGDIVQVSHESKELIKEMMSIGVRHRDIREHLKINLRTWNTLMKDHCG